MSNIEKLHDILYGFKYTYADGVFLIPNGDTIIKIWPIRLGSPTWAECLFGEFDDAFHRVFPDPSTDCNGIPCACVEASIYVRRLYIHGV